MTTVHAAYEARREADYMADLDAGLAAADEAADLAADLSATPDKITSALAEMCIRGGDTQSVPALDGRFDAGAATVERLIAVCFGGLERDSHAALSALRSRLESHFEASAAAIVAARRERALRNGIED
jgi:hypothetical protein